ncbi:MAG: hypothetical protein JOZ47_19510 [Kutzneria sp.]|nr:hypothetical protein [Kutzneria sp.]MBV9847232.1 hypothetical protein [Kutzneria sp.]
MAVTLTSLFTVAQGAVLYPALLWKVYQLSKAPRDVPLRLVTLCLVCAGAAYPLGVAANNALALQTAPAPMSLMLPQTVFLSLLVYSVVCFFLFAALEPRQARARSLVHTLPLVISIAAQTAIAASVAGARSPADYPASAVGGYFLIGDLYTVYAFTVAFVQVRRYARRASRRLARGLLMTSAAFVLTVLAMLLLIVMGSVRFMGGGGPALASAAEPSILFTGILLFIVGVSYPGAAMRLAALRIWLRHLRSYHRMHPLWSILHSTFPQDSLSRIPINPWLDAVSLRGVHHRYYRRVIECRDGLVRLSPYIAKASEGPGASSPLAERIRRALRSRADGESVSDQAVAVALPTEHGLDADAKALVTLSRALRTS